MEIPCKDCITLPICKQDIINKAYSCKLVKDFTRGKTIKMINIEKMKKIINYIERR